MIRPEHISSSRFAGAAIIAVLAATAGVPASAVAAIFADDFNTDTSADYQIVASSGDTAVTFAFDYSTLGIPAAPNTMDGSTLGLRMEANLADPGSVEGVTLHTIQQFTGSFVVRFDAWMNANGPFPGGGGGSTELLTAGVGGDGATLDLGGSSGSGGWFAVTGEGGSSRDYRLYKGGSEQFAESGQFAAGLSSAGGGAHNNSDPYYAALGGIDVGALPQSALHAQQTGTSAVGSFGFDWHRIELAVDGGAGTMRWSIDGLEIGTLDGAIGDPFSTEGSVKVGYMDIFTSVSDNAAVSFGLIDNLEVIPEPGVPALVLLGWLSIGLRRTRGRRP